MSRGLFGWCLTGYHDACPSGVNESNCSCECHEPDSSKKEAA